MAAGFGLVGTGSDTGQSIRSPASANNLVGLRPTRGLVSRRGIVPVSLTQDEAGPITRTVEDAARLLDVMAGVDPEDPVTAAGVGHQPPTYTAFLDRNGLRGARIGVLREYFGSEPVHAEVNRVMAEAIQVLRAQGAQVEDVIVPGLATLTADMATGPFETRTALNRYLASLGPGAPVKDLTALIAGGQYHPAIAGQLKEAEANGDGMAAPAYAAIFVRRDRLRVALLDAMARQRLDAVLYPHQRRLVAAIGDEQLERNGVLSNGTGFPALTLPAGFSSPTATAPLGVPVGLELLGREWSEGTLMRLGYAFEQATRPPDAAGKHAARPVTLSSIGGSLLHSAFVVAVIAVAASTAAQPHVPAARHPLHADPPGDRRGDARTRRDRRRRRRLRPRVG